jgi:hypothetical protein
MFCINSFPSIYLIYIIKKGLRTWLLRNIYFAHGNGSVLFYVDAFFPLQCSITDNLFTGLDDMNNMMGVLYGTGTASS